MAICTRDCGTDLIGSVCPACGHTGFAHVQLKVKGAGRECVYCRLESYSDYEEVAGIDVSIEGRTMVLLGPKGGAVQLIACSDGIVRWSQ